MDGRQRANDEHPHWYKSTLFCSRKGPPPPLMFNGATTSVQGKQKGTVKA